MNYARHIAAALVLALVFPPINIAIAEKPVNHLYKLNHTKKDIECLAKNIYFEARGETHKGKIAVAQVTLNRVLYQGDFNKTICGVVYQKDQFSWTKLPKINQQVKDFNTWKESIYIATGMLNGHIFIDNFEALYFHATHVKPSWRLTKQYIDKIGKHIFYL